MTARDPQQPDPRQPVGRSDPFSAAFDALASRGLRRRERIVAEIQANRRGEYTVPTWVLVLALVAMVGAIAAFLVLL